MSQENVEALRSGYAAPDQFKTFAESLAPESDFELYLPTEYPEGEQVFRGREGINALAATSRELWSEWRFVPEQFLDAGDRVVVFALLIARGHESGVPIELETTHVWTFREGRPTSMRVYRDRAEAIEAAGLRG
jgi:ketosteroid isomerase-like protein